MKFQPPKLNLKKTGKYAFLVLLSSIILVILGYSFPMTEQYLRLPSNNVIINDSALVTKQYRSEITFESTQLVDKWKLINQTKNTLYTRLSKYGAEFVKIEYKEIEEKKGEIFITVSTTKDQEKVRALIEQKGDMKVVLKKEEANFEDEKQPYAAYMPENYDDTNLSRKDFRTIYVTQLNTTAGDDAYFGILKPWIWNNAKYDKFINDNAAKTAGINNDGFVTPVTVPVSTTGMTVSAKPIFAFSLGTDASIAYMQEIVFNSGSIPVAYAYKEATDINSGLNYNYYLVFGLLIGCLAVALIASTYLTNTGLLATALSIFIPFILLVDFLKVTQTPILSISLIFGLSFAFIYTVVLNSFKDKWRVILPLFVITLLMAVPLKSTFMTFAPIFLYFVTAIPIFTYLNEKYIDIFKDTLKR